jgi:hypothetical protein
MHTRKWSLLLLTPALVFLCAADEPYKAPDGRFTVNFPGKPMVTDTPTPAGPMKTYTVTSGTGGAYLVMIMDNPALAQVNTPEAADVALDGARTGIASKGKVLSEKKIKLNDKYPGRDVIVMTETPKTYMHLRMYLAESSLYFIMAVGPTEEAIKGKDTTAYLDSFKLLKK